MAELPEDDRTQSFVVLTKGTMVSHYRIVEKIGAGGMGEVYLADDTRLDRHVALKFLPPHLCQDEGCRARFIREAQAAAKLSHPNIVTVHEVSELHGRPYIVMEHVEGQSLLEVIKGPGLTPDRVINLVIQVCDGLTEAQKYGVVHRDIKPSNILIDSHGRAKLLDFGLAAVRGTDKLTKTGSTLGTLGYMSPEQASGRTVDERSDLFSLGVVLYETITGRRPFTGEDEAATLHAVTHETPQPLARFCAHVPDGLQQVVDKALQKDPSVRYQSASGMMADLRLLRRRSYDTDQTIKRPDAKSRYLLPVVGMVTLILILIAVGYFALERTRLSSGQVSTRWTNSIAVLPFRDFSANRDQEPFCDGMTDALIGRLSAIKDLKVISMTSVMRFKSPDRDLKKIGHDLQVEKILEGSIQRDSGAVRVRMQLINVEDDAQLWSDQYDSELKSVFTIQDDISRSIVEAMKIELLGGEETALVKRATNSEEAYGEYVQGRYHWRKRNEDAIKKAIEHFETAIKYDSNYALAYSGLADAWSVLPTHSFITTEDALPKAREAAEKALELDDRLGEAHVSMGLVLTNARSIRNQKRSFLKLSTLIPATSGRTYGTVTCLGVWENGMRACDDCSLPTSLTR
ncbi:MAG: protein kinase [Candidatus Zixiibacteriota bacterium]